tara:strand:+ start:364 stop:1461 length:1098 start_codon:yes stop_codon:yes gene_type:complete
MPTPPLKKEKIETARKYITQARLLGFEAGGKPSDVMVSRDAYVTATGKKMPLRTWRAWVTAADKTPPPDEPTDLVQIEPINQEWDSEGRQALVDHMSTRFKRREEIAKQRTWRKVYIKKEGPIGICWLGDPHVDDNGCNWPMLREHCELITGTDGMFAATVGDLSNNWIGRLQRLWADQDTSKESARALVKWLMHDAGLPWLIVLLGNHDAWDPELVRSMCETNKIWLEDWQARFELHFPGGRTSRIHASHNFKGHSMWNTLHGHQKAAHMSSEAQLYIAGHTHNWALHQEESASRGFVYWLARCRGYKFIDDYADKLGHFSQAEGASIVSVFNPEAKTESAFLQCFSDVEVGADYLTWLRTKRK